MQRYSPLLVLFLIAACNSQTAKFDGERAFSFLEKQCALGPRYPGSAGHAVLRQQLIDFLKGFADTVIVQDFEQEIEIEKKTLHLTNIIAGFQIDKEQMDKNESLLIGAHWDTRPRADMDPDPAKRQIPILGANDGASGVAVLMHLAELLAQAPPDRPVYLVFFDGEDYGFPGATELYCLGSQYFARHLPIPKPKEAIVIDMIGDANLTIPVERRSVNSNPLLVRKIWGLANARGYRQFVSYIGEEIYDDHVPLIEDAGIPAIDIIDFEYPDRFSNYWHTTLDTPDKCSSKSLKAVGSVLLEYIYCGK